MRIKDLYNSMEAKWYNFLDFLDRKGIPVYKIIDPIDKIVPSFVLVLILLLIILILLVLFISSLLNPEYSVSVTVLSSVNNIPLSSVKLAIDTGCSDELLEKYTDGLGQTEFKVCNKIFETNIEKKGYYTQDLELGVDLDNIVKLKPINIQAQSAGVFVKIIDSSDEIIIGATLSYVCDGNTTIVGRQTSLGFDGNYDTCNISQFKASAQGYKEKTISWDKINEYVEIKLESDIQLAKVNFVTKNITDNTFESDVEINITDSRGQRVTIFTDTSGSTQKELSVEEYSYSAYSKGEIIQGSFSVTNTQSMDVEINFKESRKITVVQKIINMQVVSSGGNPIFSAEIEVYKDKNLFTSRRTNIEGLPNQPILISNSQLKSNYFVIINALGYEKKIVRLNPVDSNEAPQKIVLKQGENQLNVAIIDDINAKVKNAFIRIINSNFGIELDKGYTDNNGIFVSKNLPVGEYEVVASTTNASGTSKINMDYNLVQELLIKIVTGTGIIKFEFIDSIDEKKLINPLVKVYKITSGVEELIFDGNTKSGYYTTEKLFVGTGVKVVIEDEDYFKTETPIYTITRLNQTKPLYLTEKINLPNNNLVQMFLQNIYSSNPMYGTPITTTEILPGKKYYFYFDLLINTENKNKPVSVFFVGDSNKNLDFNSIKITNAYSVINSQIVFDTNMTDHIIAPKIINGEQIFVDTNAKIINVFFGDIEEKIVLPIILEIDVDQNTIKDSLSYISYYGSEKSLLRKFDFTIGEKFCIKKSSCPAFLFNNFVTWNNITKPFEEDYLLLIGDEYKLTTTVENTSDKIFSNSEMVLSIPKEKMSYGLFSGDKNEIKFPLSLQPLEKSSVKESTIDPIKSTLSFTVIESMQKIVSGINELRGLNNSKNQSLKFIIKNKEVLEITTSPTTIHEKTTEPLFIIKTKYKGKSAVSANWRVEKILDDDSKQLLTFGKTDTNGQEIIAFNATNLSKGDVVRFTVFDNNGSIEGTRDITVGSGFRPIEVLPQECLKVKRGTTNLTTTNDFYLTLDVNNSESFSIESDCNETRLVKIKTDLLSETDIRITPNSFTSFSITAKPRGDLLGVYPVQIMSIKDSRYSQLAYFDVIVKDPSSCFDLEQAIFDFRTIGQLSSKVTNRCFSGRNDNFYPKMGVSTKSVGLTYSKPGNPAEITFTARVEAHAIEAYVAGIGWGVQWKQLGCSSAPAVPGPASLYAMDDQVEVCQSVIEGAVKETQIKDPEWFVEPDIPETDPTKSFYALPTAVQNKIISDLLAPEGSTSSLSGELSETNEKVQNAFFGSCYDDGDSGYNCSENGSCDNTDYTTCNSCCGGYNTTPTSTPTASTNIATPSTGGADQGITTSPTGVQFTTAYDSDKAGTTGYIYYPSTIGDPLSPLGTCQLYHVMKWVTAPYPPKWRSCEVGDDCWSNIHEKPTGIIFPISSTTGTKIVAVGLLKERGDDIQGILEAWSGKNITVQPEFYRNLVFKHERRARWEKEVTIKTTEGVVHNAGSYEAMPVPLWTEVTTIGNHEPGDTWVDGNSITHTPADITKAPTTNTMRKAALCSQGIGFIDIRKGGTNSDGETLLVRNPAEPLVEYDPSGLVRYYIPRHTVPANMRVFLKDGTYYAEYFGTPQIAGPNIDFNLTKINLLGNEYAILTVQDWVRGNKKVETAFQIKLKGPETSCYSSDNEEGHTGADFVPKLLFKWDWQSLTNNQCDSTNPAYTYCDGVQFNITLFKKLLEFEELINKGKMSDLAVKSSFYSYLIRDNFSQNLLDDFSEYYSSTLANSPSYFYTSPGYKKFIEEEKLVYKIRNQDGTFTDSTIIPYGGLYRVEITVNRMNKGLFSMFDENNLNAEIIVTLMPVERAPNYNPFYETPFDGEVGKIGDTYVRNDYGVSFNGAEIKLNNATNPISTRDYLGNTLQKLTSVSSKNLPVLKSGIVLSYDLTNKRFDFNPSKPTPLLITITNNTLGGRVVAEYKIEERSANQQYTNPSNYSGLTNEWLLVSTSIKNSTSSCLDFQENNKRFFTEKKIDLYKRQLIWNNAKTGTISLLTTIFAPKETTPAIIATPTDGNKVILNGPQKSNTSVMITNYNLTELTEYDDLEFIFDQVKQENMCISKGNANKFNVWWNPEYLDDLGKTIITNKRGSC